MPSKPKLTHFLCIPLLTPTSTPQLSSSLTTFRQKVTTTRTSENPNGIPPEAIRPLGTLHLTLGVMSLLTPERVESALDLLNSLDLKELLASSFNSQDATREEELRITLQSLTSMHTPTSTSILYAPPLPSPPLTKFCTSLLQAFITANLILPEPRSLLLHATILNTVYIPNIRAKSRGGGHGKHKAKLTINAEEILPDYEDFTWMRDVKVERIAICRMGAVRVEDEDLGEAYVVEGSVEMP